MSVPITANLHLAGQHLRSSGDADSMSYFNGAKYTPPSTLYARMSFMYSIENKIETLYKFYPHQALIEETHKGYTNEVNENLKNSAMYTGLLWFGIYNMARRGYVMRKISY